MRSDNKVFHFLPQGAIDDTADGFLVLFAIDHRSTFSHATDLLYDLRKVRAVDRAVILVANKCDLVRSREVSTEGNG